MTSPPEHVIELIFGRWRSQILYAGAALGVFDHLAENRAIDARVLARQVGADPALLYRLLRLAAIGLLAEDDSKGFRLTEAGALLREDHPHSLKAMALLEEGPEHYPVWKHLVPILRDGKQDGFLREFGAPLFDYVRANPAYGAVFNRAMTSYSVVETHWAVAALASEDFSQIHTLCDVGGGHGHLACGLLNTYPHLQATVLDLPRSRRRNRPVVGAEAGVVRALPLPRAGLLLGVFVTLSSVGAGAIGMTALVLLYPRTPIARLVGSDIARKIHPRVR
jgi:hypothetical protein